MEAEASPGPGAASIDAWLRQGGLVVAASERAARAIAAAYHRARRAEGQTAWIAPPVQDWESFVRAAWIERTAGVRMVLNAQQEQSLWAEAIAADQNQALLEGALYRMARLASDAHRLLCAHAPRFLQPRDRANWQQDAAVFGGWLGTFDEACRAGGVISPSRLPLDLLRSLGEDRGSRPPLMLAGFDRIAPTQRKVMDAWGSWREAPGTGAVAQVSFHEAIDESAELAACVLWGKQRLAQNPSARLLIVTQDAAKRRGEMERACLRYLDEKNPAMHAARWFEFSLGIPLHQVALARGAQTLLRWLDGPIEENEVDWLFSTGQLAADRSESQALPAFMRALRRRGLERTRWGFDEFIRQKPGKPLPGGWVARMLRAKRRLEEFANQHFPQTRGASPVLWAELVPQLLQNAGWPGGRALASAEFQAIRRWEEAVETCASLGFDGRAMKWPDFLAALGRTMSQTLFTPESQDAPILIAGPAESAGLTADGIWFLGADENAWPAPGAAHPLLPLAVQREAEMPHASTQLDWHLAEAVTNRLLSSAPEVHFSFARQREGVETRPSRLIVKAASAPQSLPPEWTARLVVAERTTWIEDRSAIPFPGGAATGGSNVLTSQSQCPFKAFAAARLNAEGWKPAETGLTPAQRGRLLHAVLHSVWNGPPQGIRSHAELKKLADLSAFAGKHVRAILATQMPASARENMPARYLALEETRLVGLISAWLRYEAERVPFEVYASEADRTIPVANLELSVRLDRIDRLIDGSLLVIDYKTGEVSPKSWDLPRPDDVQLPLYAGFALNAQDKLGGLVFAKVLTGDGKQEFAGYVKKARATLKSSAHGSSNLVKRPLTDQQMAEWREHIAGLARDFLAGRAEVDPRDYPDTCTYCGLQALCRVQEQPHLSDAEEGTGGDGAND